tara:strand:+ start:301 stop:546 length:246 start_codon:yes stop_codon:yes gene_type:complete
MLNRVLPSTVVLCAALLWSVDGFLRKNLPASHTMIYDLVWPSSVVLIDWLIRGKTLSLAQIIGAIILVSSIRILTKENSSE